MESPEPVVNVVGGTRGEKIELIDFLEGTKYQGWSYEEEIRLGASRVDWDEETGQFFVDFGENLKLRRVIAGAKFPLSKRPIEVALRGYSEEVEIIKAKTSTTRFEIIIDEDGFRDLR